MVCRFFDKGDAGRCKITMGGRGMRKFGPKVVGFSVQTFGLVNIDKKMLGSNGFLIFKPKVC